MGRWVYRFGDGKAEGRAEMKNLLGGKGANLAEMSNLGLPVPAGFTITTEVCTHFYANGKSYPAGLEAEVAEALAGVEALVGRKFGDAGDPLLVSVRSGARVSMPGMMDTVLNLGLNDETAAGLAKRSGNARFAYDSYRRFIQMYANVVLGVDHHHFEELLELHKEDRGVSLDTELDAARLAGADRGLQGQGPGRAGRALPARSAAPALGCHRRRFRQLADAARRHLPQDSTTSPRTGARRSTCRPWSSATWARTAPRAWPSPATRPPAPTSSTASSWSTPRARTWSPASARRSI